VRDGEKRKRNAVQRRAPGAQAEEENPRGQKQVRVQGLRVALGSGSRHIAAERAHGQRGRKRKKIRGVVEWTLRGSRERECGRALDPLPFVPGSIVPDRGRFPKIKMRKFCQNDFSGVAGLFLKRPEKPRKFAPLEKKRRGTGRFAAASHAKGRFEVERRRTRRPKCPRSDVRRSVPRRPPVKVVDSFPANVLWLARASQGVEIRGISSVGRASGWQPEGQGFKSPILHLKPLARDRTWLSCHGPAEPFCLRRLMRGSRLRRAVGRLVQRELL
jgi:hypothetical protein